MHKFVIFPLVISMFLEFCTIIILYTQHRRNYNYIISVLKTLLWWNIFSTVPLPGAGQILLLYIPNYLIDLLNNIRNRGVARNFEGGLYYGNARKARAKIFGYAHFYVTTPSLFPFMAIATSDMVSGWPPVCVTWSRDDKQRHSSELEHGSWSKASLIQYE